MGDFDVSELADGIFDHIQRRDGDSYIVARVISMADTEEANPGLRPDTTREEGRRLMSDFRRNILSLFKAGTSHSPDVVDIGFGDEKSILFMAAGGNELHGMITSHLGRLSEIMSGYFPSDAGIFDDDVTMDQIANAVGGGMPVDVREEFVSCLENIRAAILLYMALSYIVGVSDTVKCQEKRLFERGIGNGA